MTDVRQTEALAGPNELLRVALIAGNDAFEAALPVSAAPALHVGGGSSILMHSVDRAAAFSFDRW